MERFKSMLVYIIKNVCVDPSQYARITNCQGECACK